MDQHVFELALLRAIERLIGMLLGGLAIVLGYRLFMNIPQSTESSAEAHISGKLKIILTRIGPGVFFALFGAGIIWSSYNYSVTAAGKREHLPIANPDSAIQNTVPHQNENFSYNGMGNALAIESDAYQDKLAQVRQSVRALNTLALTLPAQKLASVDPVLTHSKVALISTIWQPAWGTYEAFVNWVENGEVPPVNKSFKEPYTLYSTN